MLRCEKCRKAAATAGLGCCLCGMLFEFTVPAVEHSNRHLAVLTTNGRDDMAHAHEDEKGPPPVARVTSVVSTSSVAVVWNFSTWSPVPTDLSPVPLLWRTGDDSFLRYNAT